MCAESQLTPPGARKRALATFGETIHLDGGANNASWPINVGSWNLTSGTATGGRLQNAPSLRAVQKQQTWPTPAAEVNAHRSQCGGHLTTTMDRVFSTG